MVYRVCSPFKGNGVAVAVGVGDGVVVAIGEGVKATVSVAVGDGEGAGAGVQAARMLRENSVRRKIDLDIIIVKETRFFSHRILPEFYKIRLRLTIV